jgi:hypothetical protein
MKNHDDLIERITNDTKIVSFQTIPYRLFVTLSYLQIGIRVAGNRPSRETAIQTFDNALKALTHYYPEVQELFESGWDEENDLVIETEEIPECLLIQIPY